MQAPSNPQFLPSSIPNDVGKPSTLGGIEYNTLQPIRTICGLRRRVFFVILGAAIIAIIAGLSAGLGVTVSKNNSSAPAGTVTVTAGAGTDLRGRTTSNLPESTRGSVDGTSAPPDDGAPAPTGVTTTGATTTPPGSDPPLVTPFSIKTGRWTITLSKYSSTGDLCSVFNAILPVSTIVQPLVFGDFERYIAAWTETSRQVVLTAPPTTVTIYDDNHSATGTLTALATNVPAWDFTNPIVPTLFGCEFTGSVHLLFEETGRMRYIYEINLPDTCAIGEDSVAGGSSCSIYWRLVRTS
ncbi:hypothetical protein TWF281_011388 [Arthrobotrys megalospora]